MNERNNQGDHSTCHPANCRYGQAEPDAGNRDGKPETHTEHDRNEESGPVSATCH